MRLSLPLLMSLCASVFFGCSGGPVLSDSHGVRLVLLNPTTAKPLAGVTQLRVTLSQDGGEVFRQTLAMDEPLQISNLVDYGLVRFELAGLNDNGDVLSFGRSAEIAVVPNVEREVSITFLPVNEVLTLTARPLDARSFHTTTQTPDGRILLLGGLNAAGLHSLDSIEYYAPSSGRFIPFANFLTFDALLPGVAWTQQKTLVVSGGQKVASSTGTRTVGMNLIDPTRDLVSKVIDMQIARQDHCFENVSGELVMAAGGTSGATVGVELFHPDPANPGQWKVESGVTQFFQPYNIQSCVKTPDNRIFFQGTGDLSTGTYTYNGDLNGFSGGFEVLDYSLSDLALLVYPYGQSMVALSDSRVWMAGGRINDGDGNFANDATPGLTREFDMNSGTFFQGIDPNLSERTWGEAEAWMSPGIVVFACGGVNGDVVGNPHPMVEIADLNSGVVSLAAPMDRIRPGCSMNVLNDGTVLITGGHVPGELVEDGGAILVPYLD
jgi:hypothetical protein